MATLRKQLLALFCLAVGASSEGRCDCQAACADLVRGLREENVRLQAELRTLHHRISQLTAAVPQAPGRRATGTGDACSQESLELTSDEEMGALRGCRSAGRLTIWIDRRQVTSLADLQSLETATEINILGSGFATEDTIRSLTGLENLRSVSGGLRIIRNNNLRSFAGLESLLTAGGIYIWNNSRVKSMAGFDNLRSVQSWLIVEDNARLQSLVGLENVTNVGELTLLRNARLRSVSGLEGLQTVHTIEINESSGLSSLSGLNRLQTVQRLGIFHNKRLESLAGLEGLTSLRHLNISNNTVLPSLTGLEGLQTAEIVSISHHASLLSLRGLGNLTVVNKYLDLTDNVVLRTLEGLERLRIVGMLDIGPNHHKLTSLYPGLQNLETVLRHLWIEHCKLSSLHGLGSLSFAATLFVEHTTQCDEVVPMRFLGSPFAAGASFGWVYFEPSVWPKCITSHERAALLSVIDRNLILPEPRCETRELIELVTCTKGQPCTFSVANFSTRLEEELGMLQSVHISEIRTGCGPCPRNHMQSEVEANMLVDFGYALRDEEPGLRSLCSCHGSDPQGPVGELYLRGPRMYDGATICVRGHACAVKLEGEALERTDHVMLTSSSCSEGPSFGFAAHWSGENEYSLQDASGWYTAPPTSYQVCWKAPCSFGAGEPLCLALESTYLHVGKVELFGSYREDFDVDLGGNLSAPNVGFGVLDGDRMRLMRACGEADEGGMEALEAVSVNQWFRFGALTADRVEAGRHRLCWCQERQGDNAVECKEAHDFMADAGVVQILCLAGQRLNKGSGRCEACPAGRLQPQPTLEESCSECPVGHFSLEGASECTACEAGTVAEVAGRSTCTSCRGWESSVEARACSPNPQVLLLLASFPFSVGALCWMLVRNVKRQLFIADVWLDEDRNLVTIVGSHGLSNFGRSSFPVAFKNTGHPGLDRSPQPLLARVKDAARLELLTARGSIRSRLDTSMGKLIVAFPHDLYHRGWPLPAIICLPGLFFVAVALGILVAAADMAAEGFLAAAAAALLCTAAPAVLRLRPPAAPLRQKLSEFKVGLKGLHRCSNKGPDRAIEVGKLHTLLESFHEFIRDRTAYYLTANLLVPLTKEEQTSYAELVGPGQVQWFVSHFWGTAFTHFCASLRKHAETVSVGDAWASVRYWVCFCSNNQHMIGEELGSGWEESSFYVTLRSGHCRGTCMVLDDRALPLTRIWCIFELLQTVKLQRSSEDFEGLLFCTSGGVLNTGNGSVEVAMALAKKVADMNLATAQATSENDAHMIRVQVTEEMGSFTALNRFVCQEVHSMLAQAQCNANQQFAGVLAHLEESIEEVGVAAV